jgi:hypothetical protein
LRVATSACFGIGSGTGPLTPDRPDPVPSRVKGSGSVRAGRKLYAKQNYLDLVGSYLTIRPPPMNAFATAASRGELPLNRLQDALDQCSELFKRVALFCQVLVAIVHAYNSGETFCQYCTELSDSLEHRSVCRLLALSCSEPSIASSRSYRMYYGPNVVSGGGYRRAEAAAVNAFAGEDERYQPFGQKLNERVSFRERRRCSRRWIHLWDW